VDRQRPDAHDHRIYVGEGERQEEKFTQDGRFLAGFVASIWRASRREVKAGVEGATHLAIAGGGDYLRCYRAKAGPPAMTNGPNRILDEFARLMTDAAGAAQGVRREMETAFRAQAERLFNSMDMVQREEFEAVREMALKARAENEALAARIAELEAKSGPSAPDEAPEGAPARAAAKPRAKKAD
jgi:BMFP domain-containing protein YqiC